MEISAGREIIRGLGWSVRDRLGVSGKTVLKREYLSRFWGNEKAETV